MEAETAKVAERTDFLPIDGCGGSLGAVFDHAQVMLLCDLHDDWHIGGHPQKVDDNDRLGVRCDLLFDILRVDGPALWVDIGKDQLDSGHAEGNGSGGKGVTGHNDFIAFFEPTKDRREAQGIRGVIHRKGMVGADVRFEIRFELALIIALCLHFGVAHHVDNGFDLRFGIDTHTGGEVDAIPGYRSAPRGVTGFCGLG